MRGFTFMLGLVLAFVVPLRGQETQRHGRAASPDWVLRFDGIGPVKIGSPLSELKTILRNNVREEQSGTDVCFYVESPTHPQLGFMIIGNRVVRIDVTRPGIKSDGGIEVGDSEEKVKAAYPHAVIEPHTYTAPDGHYLTIHSPDGRFGVRFETYKGKVTGFYAGTAEAIQYVEGCE